MKRHVVRTLAFAVLTLAATMGAAKRTWHDGIPASFPQSQIAVLAVRSTWASDYDPSTFGQGPIYFNDCATFEDTGAVGVTHIQVMFAPVGGAGTPRQAPMPVDVRYKAHPTAPGSTLAACRDHAYANGAGGLWLAAWVSEVDFADGTSWHAPSGAPLYAAISAAIPLKPLGQP